MIDLQMELLDQLTIDGLDELPEVVVQMAVSGRDLDGLIRTRERQQANRPFGLQSRSKARADVPFIAQHREILMLGQQFRSDGNIRLIGRSQFEVPNDPVEGDKQMQFIAKERLLLGGAAAERCPVCSPFRTGRRNVIELDHGHRQAVNDTVRILGEIQDVQDRSTQHGESVLQLAATAVEAGAAGQMRKEIPMLLPARDEIGFAVPATAFADQRDRQQFGITTGRLWSRAGKQRDQWRIQVTHQDVHPRAKVGKVGYHSFGPPVSKSDFAISLVPVLRPLVNQFDLAQPPK